MGIDADDVKVVVNAGLHCIKKACSQYARNHPFISGVLLLFLFLYIFFPSLFNLLFYSSPFLIGLAFYSGTGQLGFCHRSIKNEDGKTHGSPLPKDRIIKDRGTSSVASQVHRGEKEDAENHGTSLQNNKSVTRSGSNNWQRVRKPIMAEMSRRTFKRKDRTAFLKEDEIVSEAPSCRDEVFGILLNEMSMKLKEEESRAATGSNLVEEGSSSNAVDAGEVKMDDVVDGTKLTQEHDCEDEVQNLKPLIPYVSASASDSEDEEETQEERNKAVAWTEDDQRNLMDLGTSEIERNRRLESLIAKRRARKLLSIQPHRNLFDSDHSVMIPILTSRAVDDADCQPGSAPSILLPSRNPFDLPYDPSEEKPVLTGGSFEEEFFSTHHKDICMCRHESFHRGPSYMGQLHEETVAKSLPSFLSKPRTSSEGPGYSRFRRESDAEDNMSQICDELEREALYNGAQSDSQVLRRPSFPIGSDAKNAKVLEDGKQDKAKDDAQITREEKENAVNKDCRKETQVRPRMVEDDSSNEWSSSSSSAITESVFDASKNEAFRNSVRKVLTCLVRKDQGTRKQIIGPAVDSLYDSSPTGFQPSKMEERSYYTRKPFHTPSYSIASDMNVEVSEAGSPTNNMESNSPPTDRESLVYDGDVDKDINSGDEELWGASPHPIASEECASRFRINETGEFNRSPLGIPYSSSSTIDFSRQTKNQPSVDSGLPPTTRIVFSDGRNSRGTGFDHQMDDENQRVIITDDAVESRSSVSSSSDVVQRTLEHTTPDLETLPVSGIGPHDVQGQQLISQVADSRATNSSHDSVPPAMLTEIVVEQVPFDRSSSPKSVVHDTVPMDGITSTKNDQNNQNDNSLLLVSEGQSDDKAEGRSKEEMGSEARLQPSHTTEENKNIMDILEKSISEVATEANSNMQGQSLVDEETQEFNSIEGNCHDSHCSTSRVFEANQSRSVEVAHLISDVESKAQQDSRPEKATVIANSVTRDPLAPVEEGKENKSIGRMVSDSTGSTSQEAAANVSSSVEEANTDVGKEVEVSNSLTDINDATIHEESESLKKATMEANTDGTGPALIHEHMTEEYKSVEEGKNDPNCLMNQKDLKLTEEAQASPNGDINTKSQLWPSNSTRENDDFSNNEASNSSGKGVTGARDTTHGNERQ